MANQWGTALRLSIFGESHGPGIGIVIDGLPPGEAIDLEAVSREMARRAPGKSDLATPRRERDEVEVVSGLLEGRTTGFPVCGLIRNGDTRSRDYDSRLRPGHADLTALLKYGGHADMRGGGHFSGRLTAGLVFAGSLAKQVLGRRGIAVYGRIRAVAGIADSAVPCEPEAYRRASERPLPVWDQAAGERMRAAILEAKAAGDSVGGVVEAAVFGVPPGLGEPFFRSVESEIASMLFSIPAVKGVEFGDGFALAAMRGSGANDPIEAEGGSYRTATNRCGGILGGISTGMPIVARACFKPTPSIGMEQDTVDGATGKPAKLQIGGRHDPCIVPRAVPVVEAGVALCILNLLLERGKVADE